MKLAVAAVIEKDGKVLLCKRSLQAANQQEKWENPGGKSDPGESPEAAIIREIMEELGVKFVIEKRIYEDSFGSEDDTYQVVIFGGSIIGIPRPMIAEETSEVRWFEISKLDEVDLATYTRADFVKFGWIK